MFATTSVVPGVVDIFLLLEHDAERRHGIDVFDRLVSSGFGELLGVWIAKLSVVAGSDPVVATSCAARPSGPRTVGAPLKRSLSNDAAGLP